MAPRTDPHETLLHRFDGNPILTAADWPYKVNSVFNPGATRLQDGTTLLLCRVEDLRGHSHFCVARSHNGIDAWEVDPQPTLCPSPDEWPAELSGIEDARVTYVPELGQYAIAYIAVSGGGPAVCLAMTADFRRFNRIGVIMPPDDKDAALLPRRIKNRWVMIHRPVTPAGSHLWVSYSPDLLHWGSHRIMLRHRHGTWWDAHKVGLACPPVETPEGWLVLYHAVRRSSAGSLYRVGLALFELEEPEHCLLRGDTWIFGPDEEYERVGDVGYVVFPCGITVQDDGDTVHVYYGAADTSIALATGSVRQMLAWLHEHGQEEYRGVERRWDLW